MLSLLVAAFLLAPRPARSSRGNQLNMGYHATPCNATANSTANATDCLVYSQVQNELCDAVPGRGYIIDRLHCDLAANSFGFDLDFEAGAVMTKRLHDYTKDAIAGCFYTFTKASAFNLWVNGPQWDGRYAANCASDPYRYGNGTCVSLCASAPLCKHVHGMIPNEEPCLCVSKYHLPTQLCGLASPNQTQRYKGKGMTGYVDYEEKDCYPRLYCDSEWQGQMKQIWNYGNTCTQHGRHFVLHPGTFLLCGVAGGVCFCIGWAVCKKAPPPPAAEEEAQRRKQTLSAAEEEERVLQEQEAQRRKQKQLVGISLCNELQQPKKPGMASSSQISIEMT